MKRRKSYPVEHSPRPSCGLIDAVGSVSVRPKHLNPSGHSRRRRLKEVDS